MRLYEVLGKIDELQGIGRLKAKIEPYTQWHDVKEFLNDLGWVQFGDGNWSMVFKKTGINYIIKVFNNDSCYLAFINFAQNNSSPHYPKFRGKIMKVAGTDFMAVRMETLSPLLDKEYLDPGFAAWIYQEYQFRKNRRINGILNSVFGLSLDRREALPKIKDEAEAWAFRNKSFAEALSNLKSVQGKCYVDLHQDNFMKRGNTWVVIDPFSVMERYP